MNTQQLGSACCSDYGAHELPRLRWPYVVFSVCAIAFAWVCLGGPLP